MATPSNPRGCIEAPCKPSRRPLSRRAAALQPSEWPMHPLPQSQLRLNTPTGSNDRPAPAPQTQPFTVHHTLTANVLSQPLPMIPCLRPCPAPPSRYQSRSPFAPQSSQPPSPPKLTQLRAPPRPPLTRSITPATHQRPPLIRSSPTHTSTHARVCTRTPHVVLHLMTLATSAHVAPYPAHLRTLRHGQHRRAH